MLLGEEFGSCACLLDNSRADGTTVTLHRFLTKNTGKRLAMQDSSGFHPYMSVSRYQPRLHGYAFRYARTTSSGYCSVSLSLLATRPPCGKLKGV